MANDPTAYADGGIYAFTTPTLPAWQRVFYEEMLMDTIRTKSILVPFATVKEDFAAVKSRQMVFSEVYDLEPKWDATTEETIWFKGGALDSRTVTLGLSLYHDVIKWGDYNEMFTYFSPGFNQIVREKVGQQITDVLDIHMRNALLEHPYPTYMGGATDRATLGATDLFDADFAEEVRAHLEDHDVPGVVTTEDGGPVLVCVTTPRVIKDIRMAAGSNWTDVQNYHSTGRKFTAEVGMWAGVRFIKTNRLRLRNAGEILAQTQLNGPTVTGQGAHATVDQVYTPGQSGSTRYITVDSSAAFAAGDIITIHSQPLGTTVLDSDGSQEIRRVVNVPNGTRLALDKPLLKAHADNDYVTKGRDVHASVFMGGPSVVWGIGERPFTYLLPKIDDANYVNRLGWRGMWEFQQFRPEYYEVVFSAGSEDLIAGP